MEFSQTKTPIGGTSMFPGDILLGDQMLQCPALRIAAEVVGYANLQLQ